MNTATLTSPKEVQPNDALKNFEELKRSILATLETYANVHRGSGHNSMVTTYLYDQARNIVLEYLELSQAEYMIVFCTPRRAEMLKSKLGDNNFKCISSKDIGLPLGLMALAIPQKALPSGIPFQTGGGTAKLISRDWVIWSKTPDKFEAGTPAIVNIIAFAKTLLMLKQSGANSFRLPVSETSAHEILFYDELEKYSGKELLEKLRETLIGKGTQVPTYSGIQPFINLDNGASTPTFSPVWDAAAKAWCLTEPAKQEIIQQVKSICGDFLGASPKEYDILFTSNTTEAINLVAESLSIEPDSDTEPVVLNTMLEHNSNELPWRTLKGISLIRLSVNVEGFMDLQELENLLSDYNQKQKFGRKRIKMVAVSGASNVLGVYNNLQQIGEIVHRYRARLLVDAAQMVAHRKVDMELYGIDYLAFSAHKIYAPFGTGVLVARKGMLSLSEEELKIINRSGEENIGGIAALGKSFTLLQRIGIDIIQEEEQLLTRKLITELKQIPGLTIYGMQDENSPRFNQKGGVVVFNLKNYMANKIARQLMEMGGIGVRYGCHCAHIIVKQLLHITPFLEGFQHQIFRLFPKLTPPGLTRVSLGLQNKPEDIDVLIEVLNKISLKTGSQNSASLAKDFRQQMDDYIKTASIKVYGDIFPANSR